MLTLICHAYSNRVYKWGGGGGGGGQSRTENNFLTMFFDVKIMLTL